MSCYSLTSVQGILAHIFYVCVIGEFQQLSCVCEHCLIIIDEYDEDNSGVMAAANVNKKDLHTLNEQKRRDAIRQAYCQLEEIVPLCR